MNFQRAACTSYDADSELMEEHGAAWCEQTFIDHIMVNSKYLLALLPEFLKKVTCKDGQVYLNCLIYYNYTYVL